MYYMTADEAMQLMVSKILELSLECEVLPADTVDLAELDTAPNKSNGQHMTDIAGNGYQRSGRTITIPPKSSYQHTQRDKKLNCCN